MVFVRFLSKLERAERNVEFVHIPEMFWGRNSLRRCCFNFFKYCFQHLCRQNASVPAAGKEKKTDKGCLYIENTAERQMIHHLQIIKPARDIGRWAPWAPTAKKVSIKSTRGKTEAAESPKMHPTGFWRARRDVSHCRCVSSRARKGPPMEMCCFRLRGGKSAMEKPCRSLLEQVRVAGTPKMF